MADLGYSQEAFGQIDRSIAQMQPITRESDGGKTDRYGKKYSWIAFFEMYGVRSDVDLLDEWRSGERTSDCDIDPSFPEPPAEWVPPLPDFFSAAPTSHVDWLTSGPIPNYQHLLVIDEMDNVEGGPWVLLDGYIQESGSNDRETFVFLRGLFMRRRTVDRVARAVQSADYLGNARIPEAGDDYYTYAGEIPWSPRYASDYRHVNGRARRHVSPMSWFSDNRQISGGRVEVPVHRWAWESYHSSLNQVSGVELPAPALCEVLGLVSRRTSFDLWDADGNQATVYREFHVADRYGNSNVLYLRKDLVERYLGCTDQAMVWIPWGERTLHYRQFNHGSTAPEIQEALQRNNFGEVIEYTSVAE